MCCGVKEGDFCSCTSRRDVPLGVRDNLFTPSRRSNRALVLSLPLFLPGYREDVRCLYLLIVSLLLIFVLLDGIACDDRNCDDAEEAERYYLL